MKSSRDARLDSNDEINRLVKTLFATERRLVELTRGEAQSVTDEDGQVFLLRSAQEQMREAEALKQSAILDALPAEVVLLDARGVIVSVNRAWREFVGGSGAQCQNYYIGERYPDSCVHARCVNAAEAALASEGVREVIAGRSESFTIEYSCHSRSGARWYLLLATPLAGVAPRGAVVMHVNITERREAEAALRRLAGIVETSDDAIFANDIAGLVTSWNRGAERTLGYRADEIIGSSYFDLVPPELQAAEKHIFENVLAGQSVDRYETRWRTKDARTIEVSLTISAVRDSNGRIVNVARVARDVTERNRSEQAVRESDERFQQLAAVASDVFWIRSADMNRLEYVSPAFEKIWGRPMETLYRNPHSWREAIYPADRPAVQAAFAGLRTDTPRISIQYRIVRANGEIRWVLVRGFQVKNPAGEVIRLGGTVTDISEQYRMDEAIRESEERFAIAFQHAPIGVTLATPEGRWVQVNRAFCAMVGYSEEELLGRSFSGLTAPADREASHRYLAEIVAGRINNYEIEKQYIHRRGHFVTVLLSVAVVRSRTGVPRYLVSQIQDITARREAEAEFRALSERTEQRERMLSTALSSISDFSQIFDREGRLVFANRSLLSAFDCTLEELMGTSFSDRGYQPEIAARLLGGVQRVFATGERVIGETPWVQVGNVAGYFEYIYSPILAADRTVEFVVGATRNVTERKRHEAALRASEATMAAAQQIAHFASWEIELADPADVDSNILRWSDEMFRIVGLEPNSVPVTNELFFNCVPVEEHAAIRVAIAVAIRDGKLYTIVHRVVRPDGSVRIVSERAQVFYDDVTGRPLRVVGTAHDITERRKTEEDLARSEREQRALATQLQEEHERLVEAQEVAKLGNWEVDARSLALVWSDGMYSVFEVERAAFPLTYAAFLELVHVEDRPMVNERFFDSHGNPSAHGCEHRIVTPSGKVKYVEVRWRALFGESGTTVRVRGTCQDITERKIATDALRLSEKRFKALFEQAAVGVTQCDATTGRFIHANQRFCEMLGRTAEELRALAITAVTHPEDIAEDRERMRQLESGETREFSGEKRYIKKDGSELWVEVTVSAMWSPGEAPDYTLAISQDITARKRLEDQFRQAQKMEAIGTLAGGIAHDFNNILAAINGYAELSRMLSRNNPEVRSHLDAVLQASGRAADLVRQILTFSRQQKLERRPMKLLSVVAESLMLLRSTIPSTIEFSTSLTPDAPTVLADATQVHQLLMNLGTNAWHAMKDHPGRLTVSLERWVVDEVHASAQSRLHPGVYARLSVSDTGMGMDEATRRRIFEPFFTTKGPGEGTGLGLAVVHGIMDSHDGAVTVYSQPGEGTVFRLYFPAHETEAVPLAAESGPPPTGSGEKILFVDDEELLVRLGRKTLSALGYEVESTTLAAEALAMVEAAPDRYAVVITDHTMPRMTGMTLARLLREIRPGLPIILTTGYSQSLTTESVHEAGLNQLLLKPFTMHTLGGAVQAALSPGRQRRRVYGSDNPF